MRSFSVTPSTAPTSPLSLHCKLNDLTKIEQSRSARKTFLIEYERTRLQLGQRLRLLNYTLPLKRLVDDGGDALSRARHVALAERRDATAAARRGRRIGEG